MSLNDLIGVSPISSPTIMKSTIDEKATSSTMVTTKARLSIDYNILSKLTGDWVCDKYLKTLKKFKSPLKAEIEREKDNDLSYFSIKQNKNDYYLKISYGFHNIINGKVVKFLKTKNKYNLVIESGTISKSDKGTESYISQFEIVLENVSAKFVKFDITEYKYLGDTPNGVKNSLIIQSDNKKYTFTRLGNVQEYMNNLIIKGTYVDDKANKYVFTDSKAIFPDKNFTYRVNFDSFNYLPDYIYDPYQTHGYSNFYFYEWRDNYLDLFTSQNGETNPATFTRVYHIKKLK